MELLEVLVNFIVGILGLAYPILLQIVSGLDQRYESIKITEYFQEHWSYNSFRRSLWISLTFLIIHYSLIAIPFDVYPPPDLFELIQCLINWTLILLVLFVFWTLFSFLNCVERALIFINPKKFTLFLTNDFAKKTMDLKDEKLLLLSDILILSMRKESEPICSEIISFLSSNSRWMCQENEKGEIEYVRNFYSTINLAVQEISTHKSKKVNYLGSTLMAELYLPSENQRISDATYSWIWSNLIIAIDNERDDLVITFWKRAHQYFSMTIRHIQSNYNNEHEVINQIEIDERESVRKKFIEFTTALGGLLLYSNRPDAIRRIFLYTTSIPPRYELLPQRMNEIFDAFIKLHSPHDWDSIYISHRFFFPEMEGLHSDGRVQYQISRYLAVLFLRQYSIQTYLSFQEPLAMPTLPSTQGERKRWIEYLPNLENHIAGIYNDKDLLKKLNLDFISEDYCLERNVLSPINFIKDIQEKIADAYGIAEFEQPISEERKALFFESSKTTITEAISDISKFQSSRSFENASTYYFGATNSVISKAAFAENQGIDYGNYYSYLGSALASEMRSIFSETFFLASKIRYLVKEDDLFRAIDKLELNNEFVIVTLGLNLKYYGDKLKVVLSNGNYRDLKVISQDYVRSNLTRDSIFILKKSDLPNLRYPVGNAEYIEKYGLHEIDTDHHIYANVNDLNENVALRESIQPENPEDLRSSVLLSIYVHGQIVWKKDARVIRIEIASPYRNHGIPMNVDNVQRFDYDLEIPKE